MADRERGGDRRAPGVAEHQAAVDRQLLEHRFHEIGLAGGVAHLVCVARCVAVTGAVERHEAETAAERGLQRLQRLAQVAARTMQQEKHRRIRSGRQVHDVHGVLCRRARAFRRADGGAR